MFSWYLDALTGNSDLLDSIRDVLNSIGLFAFPRLAFGANPATDVLRDLYQQLLPRELRGALGEFLTPQWLAEACLERLASAGAPLRDGRILDPTCGTATFLLPVLSRRAVALRAASKEFTSTDVQTLLDGVVGFDLNPVAVIAARVNFVIALGDLANVGGLTLPIWRADSILVPDVATVQSAMTGSRLDGREWMALSTSLEKPFPVPPQLANAGAMPVALDRHRPVPVPRRRVAQSVALGRAMHRAPLTRKAESPAGAGLFGVAGAGFEPATFGL